MCNQLFVVIDGPLAQPLVFEALTINTPKALLECTGNTSALDLVQLKGVDLDFMEMTNKSFAPMQAQLDKVLCTTTYHPRHPLGPFCNMMFLEWDSAVRRNLSRENAKHLEKKKKKKRLPKSFESNRCSRTGFLPLGQNRAQSGVDRCLPQLVFGGELLSRNTINSTSGSSLLS